MRKFTRRIARRPKANVFWLPGGPSTFFSAVTSGGSLATLIKTEAPTITTAAVTSQPVEDLTLLRLQATMRVSMGGSGVWSLLLMQLTNDGISPGATTGASGDRRILWSKTYDTVSPAANFAGFTGMSWGVPNHAVVLATAPLFGECDPKAVNVDVKLNVRLEDGAGLYWVAEEESGTATFSMDMHYFRILARRSAR